MGRTIGHLLMLVLALIAPLPGWAGAPAAEVCHFAGRTSFGGHIAVTTTAATTGGVTNVDVVLTFDTTTMLWLQVHYLVEEISEWHGEKLASVATNTRYLAGHRIIRQQWDDFRRGPGGLEAYRVQGKTLADFTRDHPGFLQHWDVRTFGQPWLGDYAAASPVRRPDLDLANPLPEGLDSPLAMGFYWVRRVPPGSRQIPVFLPGFKSDRLANASVTASAAAGDRVVQARLHHPSLDKTPPSTATAQLSPAGYLRQLSFEGHTSGGSAAGTINQEGCQGTPVNPVGSR